MPRITDKTMSMLLNFSDRRTVIGHTVIDGDSCISLKTYDAYYTLVKTSKGWNAQFEVFGHLYRVCEELMDDDSIWCLLEIISKWIQSIQKSGVYRKCPYNILKTDQY